LNILEGILLKLASALTFAVMQALVRSLGEDIPVGEVVFFRSAFAVVPVVVIYALRQELAAAIRTARPLGHIGRGVAGLASMFCSFAALARLPLVEVTAISFASPFVTVALAALLLKEHVRFYRWSAVGVGFLGVMVMLAPNFDAARLAAGHGQAQTLGAVLALAGACFNAGAVIQTRRLTGSETTSSIVLYFSIACAVGGLLTLPLGWAVPTRWELAALIGTGVLGGAGHLFLTESYRHAPASVIAPFDYAAILFAFLLGYLMFDEVPTPLVVIGAAIVVEAGLFVLWRERRLGLKRARDAEGPASGA